MMKTLKFTKALSKLILKGEKEATWRLFDDKDLTVGDHITFIISETGDVFAEANLTNVKETTFKKLTDRDWEGHERFESDREMYNIYNEYYDEDIDENTIVKIIKFKLLAR